ncbi:hypothetical protein [Stakelama tenebrarum]|uniref:Uncharacterized protein n=1 Tax=Stakelama tenebrarum TaxID=2711215 RepID=A0A6G6YAG2_9SPHN|nr:hypothetical protein [Sphingosinithalassobacter tenebrarum]QIG81563.1 hypothetical protein G5C33_18405 [Sphingosinithalassobacter tenebrarum]
MLQAITLLLLPALLFGDFYRSEEPLFALNEGVQPLAEGYYGNGFDSTLSFTREGDHYHLAGRAWPATVALIPIDGSPGLYLFQQSDGDHDAFYGLLRLIPDKPGFALFAADCSKPTDRHIAEVEGGLAEPYGNLVACTFDSRDGVISALTMLANKATNDDWQVYHRL